jgi:hypothetical protein
MTSVDLVYFSFGASIARIALRFSINTSTRVQERIWNLQILANIIELKVLSLEKHENKMDLHTQPNEEGHDRM